MPVVNEAKFNPKCLACSTPRAWICAAKRSEHCICMVSYTPIIAT